MTEFKESTNTTSAGTASAFGAADINKITRYLNGGTDIATVVIDSSTTIQNGKLHVATITNGSGVSTFPTTTTTLIGTDTTNTLTNKTLTAPAHDSYSEHNTISAPSNPASGKVRLYAKQIDANNDGWFIKEKVNGAVVEIQVA